MRDRTTPRPRPGLDPDAGPAIAIDGGTSTTRARLMVAGRAVATSSRPVGVRDNARTTGPSPLAAALRATLDDLVAADPAARSAPIVAAGMLSSAAGLVDVPHVGAPAGVDEVAAGARIATILEVDPRPILFVPGVRTPPGPGPDGWEDADLMRGEESETFGALAILGLTGPCAFVWPGSHAKLVAVDGAGRIASSHTTIAGELTAAVASATLIASSLPGSFPDLPDAEAVAAGMRVGARAGIGRAAFLVRVADLSGRLDPAGRASFWVGAVIGDDVARIANRPEIAGPGTVWVGGREPQRSLYARAIAAIRGGPTRRVDDETAGRASAVGALIVAAAFSRR